MPSMSASDWLRLVNEIRIWAAGLAALAAVAAGAAGYAQIRLQTVVSKQKDEAFDAFRKKSELEVAAFHERAALLEKETSQNLLDLERERNARIRLQRALSGRTITPEQRAAFKHAINGRQLKAAIMYRGGDPEAEAYAMDLDSMLLDSGIATSVGFIANAAVDPGLSLIAPEGSNRELLEAAFEAASIPFNGKLPRSFDRLGLITLWVGIKPAVR